MGERSRLNTLCLSFSTVSIFLGSVKSENESRSVMSTTLWYPMDYKIHGIPQARIPECIVFPFSMGFSQPRDRTQVSRLQAGSLPAEPPGKPKNTGLGSLSLLQWIFPTQKSSQGLLHCRQILYQMSCQ